MAYQGSSHDDDYLFVTYGTMNTSASLAVEPRVAQPIPPSRALKASGATLQVISEALLSLSAEEADGTFATVYMPIVVEGHKR